MACAGKYGMDPAAENGQRLWVSRQERQSGSDFFVLFGPLIGLFGSGHESD